MAKLSDYAERWGELEKSDNPFATVVMAHLKTQQTRNDLKARKYWKFRLIRNLYERGWEKDDILKLFRFMDWLMRLPEGLEREFWDEFQEYEEERRMQYVTSVERIGIEKGIKQGIEQGIRARPKMADLPNLGVSRQIPALKILHVFFRLEFDAFLELEQIILFSDGH